MVLQLSSRAFALFFAVLVCVFSLTGARVGSPTQVAATSSAGLSQTGSHVHHHDLADVLSKAVDMMNSGVLQFLKEETSASLPARGSRRPEDFLRVAKSQERALQLLKQMSNDFTSIHGVAQKMKNETHICSHVQHRTQANLTSDAKDMVDEIKHLKETVNFLLKKAEICQDNLKTESEAASNCQAKITTKVQTTADADEKQNADTKEESEMLRRENADLRQRNDELERRNAGLEGGGVAQKGAMTGEVNDLRKKVEGLQDDKQAMIHTMQQFMRTNETETLTKELQQEIKGMQRQYLQMEMRYQQKIATLEKRWKDATDKNKDMKELTKETQEDDVNKDQAIEQLKGQLGNFQKAQNAAALDKKQLLTTLQGVLRENTGFQNSLMDAQNSLRDAQNKLKHSEEVMKRDCPAPETHASQIKAEPQPSQAQSVKAQNMDDGDAIATMGDALPINKYINAEKEQEVIQDATQADPSLADGDDSIIQPLPRDIQKTSQSSPVNLIPSEEELPPSLKLSTPHSAPVRSALSRWLGVNGAAEAAASRLPQVAPHSSPVDNSDSAESTSLLTQAQQSVDEAGEDDVSLSA